MQKKRQKTITTELLNLITGILVNSMVYVFIL